MVKSGFGKTLFVFSEKNFTKKTTYTNSYIHLCATFSEPPGLYTTFNIQIISELYDQLIYNERGHGAQRVDEGNHGVVGRHTH